IDSSNNSKVSGAVLRIFSSELGYSKEFTTDSSGKINISNLQPGTYHVEEISAPDGYDYSIIKTNGKTL
ncbi:MAG: prealbumin-like fold domain-containing protein, partial [Lachnospirales bacterium]